LFQVARVFRNPLVSCVDARRLTAVVDKLAKVWEDKARQLSREMRAARLAGVTACILDSVTVKCHSLFIHCRSDVFLAFFQ
jgi:hypothetical protein